MIRMCLTCGYWEVDDEVEPISLFIIKPLGVTSTLLILLPCYAHRRGLGLRDIHDRCECLIMVQLKVATKTHIWVD